MFLSSGCELALHCFQLNFYNAISFSGLSIPHWSSLGLINFTALKVSGLLCWNQYSRLCETVLQVLFEQNASTEKWKLKAVLGENDGNAYCGQWYVVFFFLIDCSKMLILGETTALISWHILMNHTQVFMKGNPIAVWEY